MRSRVVGIGRIGQRLALDWRIGVIIALFYSSCCLERCPQIFIFRSFNVQIIQTRLNRVNADGGFGGWFERGKEDICQT